MHIYIYILAYRRTYRFFALEAEMSGRCGHDRDSYVDALLKISELNSEYSNSQHNICIYMYMYI